MDDVLGPLWVILSPRSAPFSEEEIAAHTFCRPLAEFGEEYGIAPKPEQVEALLPQDEDSQPRECEGVGEVIP
jgi:hypothetical protein